MSYLMIFISYLVYIYCHLFQNVDYNLKSHWAKLPQYTISSPHINHNALNQSTTFIISHYKLTACLRLLLIATFPVMMCLWINLDAQSTEKEDNYMRLQSTQLYGSH